MPNLSCLLGDCKSDGWGAEVAKTSATPSGTLAPGQADEAAFSPVAGTGYDEAWLKRNWPGNRSWCCLRCCPSRARMCVLACFWWAAQSAPVAIWTVGLSALLGLVTWKLRAATPAARQPARSSPPASCFPPSCFLMQPWHTALIPALAVSVLAFAATRVGRAKKERLGTAERRQGRSASQVAANLGLAALVVERTRAVLAARLPLASAPLSARRRRCLPWRWPHWLKPRQTRFRLRSGRCSAAGRG